METSTALLRSCLSFGLQRPIVRSNYCSISWVSSTAVKPKLNLQRRSAKIHGSRRLECRASSVSNHLVQLSPIKLPISDTTFCPQNLNINTPCTTSGDQTTFMKRSTILIDLDPATARTAITILSPLLPAFAFLFVVRIVMSWYPKLPVGKFPYVLAYAPTEPLLKPTRKLIPPVGGVDVTPVVWFGLLTFINEILVGPQGLLVLLSQQFKNHALADLATHACGHELENIRRAHLETNSHSLHSWAWTRASGTEALETTKLTG